MDVVTWGETMILFTPQTTGYLENINQFHKGMAGAESNVAIGLSRLGHSVAWISRLGADSFGRFIYKTLRGEGVDVSHVTFDENHPTGVFFKEFLGDSRTNVFYYRKGSAASYFEPGTVSLEPYKDAKYFVITGITPALSARNQETVFELIQQAHSFGMKVVFDPNIRLKLWCIDEARLVLNQIAANSDIVLPGVDEGALLTGREKVPDIAQAFIEAGAEQVVIKLGQKGAYYQTTDENGYVAGFTVRVVNEIGAGDAFLAGFVSGLLDNLELKEAVKRACALGALAVTSVGDYENLPYRSDLEAFMNGTTRPTR